MSKKNQIKFKENSFVDIPLDLLVPADWNYKTDDEDRQEKLKNNIKRNGQVENIIVRLLSTGFYEIVNGNHRYQALKELGNFPNVHCYNMGVISDSKAKRIAIETNETRFDTDNIKLAKTIKSLQEEFSFEELEDTMPYTIDELNNFNNLLNFKWSQFDNTEENDKDNTEENDKDNNFEDFNIKISQETKKLWVNSIDKIKKEKKNIKLENDFFEYILKSFLGIN